LLFEPYVITLVPILLKSFSHASDHVREAAQGAAKVDDSYRPHSFLKIKQRDSE
jgi:hypothetical protein